MAVARRGAATDPGNHAAAAAYVRQALAGADDFTKPLQDLITEYCWGAVCGRDGLTLKARSMLNLAMISVLNRPNELRTHIKAALTNGVTRDEIRDIPPGRHRRRRQLSHRA
jgi:alkylhydroperoxidase/carboxymuconolactone decarboxylase family protein YurZ